MAGPLEGIRVIDFGRFIAAPYCAMMFADMGADVIRVERREGGEDRYLGPVTASGEGGLFLNVNRNKRAITLEPAHPMGSEIIRRLVLSADIVIVNLPFDVMKKLGLDYESLRRIKEETILVMASAFGPDGPYRDRVGFDSVGHPWQAVPHQAGARARLGHFCYRDAIRPNAQLFRSHMPSC